MIGEADIANGTGRFLLFNPVKNSNLLEFLPHRNIRQMMHEIIIHVICTKAGEFFIEVSINSCRIGNHVLRELRRNVNLFPQMIPLENLSDRCFAPRVDIGSIEIVYSGFVRRKQFLFRFIDIDGISFFGKAHTSKAKDRQWIAVFIRSVLHVSMFSYVQSSMAYPARMSKRFCFFNEDTGGRMLFLHH